MRYTSTCTHKDGIIACAEKTVDCNIVLTYHTVSDKLHTESLYLTDLITYNALRQTILRNTIHQDSSRLCLSLKNSDIKALTSQISRNSQTCRTRTDDSNAATGLLRQAFTGKLHLRIKIGNKLFQFSYLYRLTLLSQHTMTLALLLMRAYTSADSRQICFCIEDTHCSTHVTHREFMHKVRNVVFNRTSLLTLRNLAVKATFGFLYRLTGREALVYNLKSGRGINLSLLLIHIYSFLTCLFVHYYSSFMFYNLS